MCRVSYYTNTTSPIIFLLYLSILIVLLALAALAKSTFRRLKIYSIIVDKLLILSLMSFPLIIKKLLGTILRFMSLSSLFINSTSHLGETYSTYIGAPCNKDENSILFFSLLIPSPTNQIYNSE